MSAMRNALAIGFVFFSVACAGAAQDAGPQAAVTCPDGSTWNGSACVAAVDPSCPAGTAFAAGRGCVAQVIQQPVPPTESVSRTVWIERMAARLPPRLCELAYMRQCFTTTPPECERTVARLTRSCLRDAEPTLPRAFDEDTGRREGTRIGECVGAAYDADMRGQGRFINTLECNDPSHWH